MRIALANLPIPENRDQAVALAEQAVIEAGDGGAAIIAFPECYIPGYRWPGRQVPPPDGPFLERAWARVAKAAAHASIWVILGTERVDGRLAHISAIVIDDRGVIAGFQDKEQLDPPEETVQPYTPGRGRRVFHAGPVTFGISICHEGFRYPETVRWSARHGAQIVFHPHYAEAEEGSFRPERYADPANSFHEKAALCRAAENTIYYATVNCASPGSPTTSAVVNPDGTLLCYQPYGVEGLLYADLDLSLATGYLAGRLRG